MKKINLLRFKHTELPQFPEVSVKKKKLRKTIIIGSIVAAVVLPASVYAALQPINLETTVEEQLPSTVQKSGSSLTSEEVLLQVPPIVSATKEIFRSISTGNIEGAIERFLGILGELGLLDPAYQSARVATNPENPYSNPRTPEEVYDLQRHTDIVRSEIPQKLSQIVFGPQGQQVLYQQTQAVFEAQQASLKGQQGVVETYQQSAQQAIENATYAENVRANATKAKSAIVSQDVLKAIAQQNEELAKIAAGNSAQLAHLGKAASFQSAQMSAANAQLVALNDKTQTLAVLGASQNYQMAQINAAIDRQSHYEQVKDSLQQNAAYQASNLIYIPGLVPKGNSGG